MTKEMRPSHRIDVLTGALVYYGIRTKAKLGTLAHLFYLVLTMLCMYIASLLCVRLERALKAKLIAEESLHQLLPGFVIEQPDEMKKWIAEEELACAENNFKKPVAWKLLYFQTLLSYYSLKKLLVSGMSSESKSEQLEWLENRLEEMERSHSIPSCWLPTDEEYKKSEYAVLLTKKEQILMQIWKSGQSRLFLLQLKRRYADGQKIAKKALSSDLKSN
jgi:hypothetical protein